MATNPGTRGSRYLGLGLGCAHGMGNTGNPKTNITRFAELLTFANEIETWKAHKNAQALGGAENQFGTSFK